MLFLYEQGREDPGCGTELAFNVNFTFSLTPKPGKAGANGFAFVISAKNRPGSSSSGGVGYGGMESRSMAIEFDTFQDPKHGDPEYQHIGLNVQGRDASLATAKAPFVLNDRKQYTAWVDYEPGDPGTIHVFLANSSTVKPGAAVLERRFSLCGVVQPGPPQVEQGEEAQVQAYYVGFVASTTMAPFQKHVVLDSWVHAVGRGVMRMALGFVASTTVAPFQKHVVLDSWVHAGTASSRLSHTPLHYHTRLSITTHASPLPHTPLHSPLHLATPSLASYGPAVSDETYMPQQASLFPALLLFLPILNASSPLPHASLCSHTPFTRLAAYGLAVSVETYVPQQASPFPRYASADYRVAADKKDSWRFSDYHSWDSVPFLGWPVKDQSTCISVLSFWLTLALLFLPSLPCPHSLRSLHSHPSLSPLSNQTFKYQDPQCYTADLNHVVLVVGYFIFRDDGSQNRIAPPFWIVRNSWGVEWGDRGHMRMDIQGGDGVCGINVLPGIVPIVKIPKDPCGLRSYKGDGDLQPTMNPCGRFTCRPIPKNDTNSCDCIIPEEPKQPFAEVANGYGSNTCAYVDVCGSYFKNPCAVGTCINDGKGAYSCICPPSYVPSRTILNFPTCDPVNVTATSMVVSGGDTCRSMAYQLVMTRSKLIELNPSLDCAVPIKSGRSVCIERSTTYAYTVPLCLKYGVMLAQDSCERMLQGLAGDVNATMWAMLYRTKPGLVCSQVIPTSIAAVGSNIGVQV
ncbi:unnamed protein product [Closterium sp. Yama58-4]|nr:unnamed protein product [Closterium sp. Yama58-4]